MDIKKIVIILTVVVILAFGVGIYSLRNNDDFSPITLDGRSSLFVRSDDSNVRIGFDGIEVKDGDDYVSIGWDGIHVSGGDDRIDIDWQNSNVYLTEDLDSINEIVVSSSFADIDIVSESRDDLGIDFSGQINSDTMPSVKVERLGRKLIIKIGTDKSINSDVSLKLLIPEYFDDDNTIKITTSSGDVIFQTP